MRLFYLYSIFFLLTMMLSFAASKEDMPENGAHLKRTRQQSFQKNSFQQNDLESTQKKHEKIRRNFLNPTSLDTASIYPIILRKISLALKEKNLANDIPRKWQDFKSKFQSNTHHDIKNILISIIKENKECWIKEARTAPLTDKIRKRKGKETKKSLRAKVHRSMSEDDRLQARKQEYHLTIKNI